MGVSSNYNLPILSLWDKPKVNGSLIYYKDRCWRQQKRRKQEIKKEREKEKASKQDGETDKLNCKKEFAWAAIFLHARCPWFRLTASQGMGNSALLKAKNKIFFLKKVFAVYFLHQEKLGHSSHVIDHTMH